VNGIDVTEFVNQHDPWFPLRGMLRPDSIAGLQAALDALDAAWAATVTPACELTDVVLHESVGDEFSFVETQQHLVFGVDKWFSAPLLGQATFHAVGLQNTGSRDFGWFGVDLDARPTLGEVLAVRTERSGQLRPSSTACR